MFDKEKFNDYLIEGLKGFIFTLSLGLVAGLLLFFFPFTAYADGPVDHPDSTHAVTLTPAQTLALFGTEIQGILYPTKNGSPVSVTFDYAFPLNSIGDMDSGGSLFPDVLASANTFLTKFTASGTRVWERR